MQEFWIILRDLLGEHRSAKLLFLTAVISIIFVNFLDNSSSPCRSYLLIWKFTDFVYQLSIFILASSIFYIIYKNFEGVLEAKKYKKKYPIKSLDKKFYLFNFGGKGFLLDRATKKHHWIASWQTAQDCDFQEYWTKSGKNFEDLLKEAIKVTTISGSEVDLTEYRKVGKKIHTRGIPGT